MCAQHMSCYSRQYSCCRVSRMSKTLLVAVGVSLAWPAIVWPQSNDRDHAANGQGSVFEYPSCSELYPDVGSVEHKACIEFTTRHPGNWDKASLADNVRKLVEEQQQQERAKAAEEHLRARREAVENKPNANREHAATGQSDVFEFKGVELGSNISIVKDTGRFSCHKSEDWNVADVLCTPKYGSTETIAGVPVTFLGFFYYGDNLGSIYITFREHDFAHVAEALVEKYGQAIKKTTLLRNRMGATFENVTYVWRRGSGILIADRYAGTVDKSSVRYQASEAIEEFHRRDKSSVKKGAKDL